MLLYRKKFFKDKNFGSVVPISKNKKKFFSFPEVETTQNIIPYIENNLYVYQISARMGGSFESIYIFIINKG